MTDVAGIMCSLSTILKEQTFLQYFVENIEEMFPRYYMHSDVMNKIRTSSTGVLMISSIQSYLHDLQSTIGNEETFLEDYLVILKHSIQNCWKIQKSMFPLHSDMLA